MQPIKEQRFFDSKTNKMYTAVGSIGEFTFPEIPINAYLYPVIPLYNEESLAPVKPNSEWGIQ